MSTSDDIKWLRDNRVFEKLIHSFDLGKGSKPDWLPGAVALRSGVGYERPWAYYMELAEQILGVIEDSILDEQSPEETLHEPD